MASAWPVHRQSSSDVNRSFGDCGIDMELNSWVSGRQIRCGVKNVLFGGVKQGKY